MNKKKVMLNLNQKRKSIKKVRSGVTTGLIVYTVLIAHKNKKTVKVKIINPRLVNFLQEKITIIQVITIYSIQMVDKKVKTTLKGP